MAHRERDRVGSVAQLQPRGHVVQDVLHRPLGVGEPSGDLAGVAAVSHQPQDLDLTGREAVERQPARRQDAALERTDLAEQLA